VDAAGRIAVAVEIAVPGADRADILDPAVAGQAALDLHPRAVGIVAGGAGVRAWHMVEPPGIAAARILEAATHPGPLHHRRRCAVMDIDEALLRHHRIRVVAADRRRYRVARLPPCVTDGADRVRPQIAQRLARGEGDRVQRMRRGGVAGRAADRRVDRGRVIDHARRAAVGAQPVDESRFGMAGGTGHRHLAGLVPVGERPRVVIGVTRPQPVRDQRFKAFQRLRCGGAGQRDQRGGQQVSDGKAGQLHANPPLHDMPIMPHPVTSGKSAP
jgi:hypothetical protein